MKRFTLLPLTLSFAMPLFAYAQTVESTISILRDILNSVVPVLLIIATIVFIWGLIMYITSGGDEEKLAGAKFYMMWSIIALFVMVSIWGIVGILVDTFDVGGQPIPGGVGGIN